MSSGRCSLCGGVDSGFAGRSLRHQAVSARQARRALSVEAKKVIKRTEIVLAADVKGLGSRGDIAKATYGYFRNFLQPQKLAVPLTDNYLQKLDREEKVKQQEYSRGVAKAQSLATALRTIGKFTISKRAGEGGKIFGSVSAQEVVDAIYGQTGQKLDKEALQLPEMKTVGTHQAAIQLHPDVIGRFSVVISKAKQK